MEGLHVLNDVEGLHVVKIEKWKVEGLHAVDDVDDLDVHLNGIACLDII